MARPSNECSGCCRRKTARQEMRMRVSTAEKKEEEIIVHKTKRKVWRIFKYVGGVHYKKDFATKLAIEYALGGFAVVRRR